ncbi:MAG: OmpH family outer membrane protein [Chitinophagaceae bacterium]|nr:OmpH family outer membrane protein [Chitinophagaceae bacterium]
MKKLHVLIAAVGLLMAGSASAQTKIAYVRIDDIVSVMPDLAPEKINMDTVGAQFVKDSVMPRLNYVQSEYNRKLTEYSDSTKPKSVRDLILKDLQAFQEELSNADAQIQQAQQYKQQELLKPYYAKAKKAIEQVAKEKGYTHVMNTDVFLVAPEADDISLAVVAKLGIKLPNPPANNKPAPKTGN